MDFELLIGIFPQVLIDGITLGFMYALIALGYTMVYGVLEFINFAHSEIFIVGAFVGVELLLGMKAAGWLDVLPWILVLLLILVAGMAFFLEYAQLSANRAVARLVTQFGKHFRSRSLTQPVENIHDLPFPPAEARGSFRSHVIFLARLR